MEIINYLEDNKINYMTYEDYTKTQKPKNNKKYYINIDNSYTLNDIKNKFGILYDPVFNVFKININKEIKKKDYEYEFNEISIKIINEINNKIEWITFMNLYNNKDKYFYNPHNLIDLILLKINESKRMFKYNYITLFKNNITLNLIQTFGCYLLETKKDISIYFNINKIIGMGSFSKVFEVKLKKILKIYYNKHNLFMNTNNLFILKKLNKKKTEKNYYTSSNRDLFDNNNIRNLLHEVKILELLNDENIIKSFGCFLKFDDIKKKYNIYILLEHGGFNLKTILRQRNQVLTNKIIDYLPRLLITLKNMHNHNVYHRDIKLENLVYDMDKEQIKFIDFGFSCNYDYGNCNKLMGTKSYLIPEYKKIFADNKKSLKIFDNYAFSLVCFIIITDNLNVLRNIMDGQNINTNKFNEFMIKNKNNIYLNKLFKFMIKYLKYNPQIKFTLRN